MINRFKPRGAPHPRPPGRGQGGLAAAPTRPPPRRVSPELQQFYNNQGRLPDGRVVLCFGEEFPDMTPLRSKLILVQIEQLYVQQLVEEARKSCGPSSVVQPPEEPQQDQVFRMFPDICASHQRPFFRENQQITV
ncbi:interferon regulatory factor 8-like [Suricata suricatta]|uniref:interferon regulatory factor 8-like n=1 Tax=Suricata suricatta TaxID=37032 RepID=UPI0011560409|nr:interferon regulatory factor 8-like [Suricata suricatta]